MLRLKIHPWISDGVMIPHSILACYPFSGSVLRNGDHKHYRGSALHQVLSAIRGSPLGCSYDIFPVEQHAASTISIRKQRVLTVPVVCKTYCSLRGVCLLTLSVIRLPKVASPWVVVILTLVRCTVPVRASVMVLVGHGVLLLNCSFSDMTEHGPHLLMLGDHGIAVCQRWISLAL
jgi:hypothetical protein